MVLICKVRAIHLSIILCDTVRNLANILTFIALIVKLESSIYPRSLKIIFSVLSPLCPISLGGYCWTIYQMKRNKSLTISNVKNVTFSKISYYRPWPSKNSRWKYQVGYLAVFRKDFSGQNSKTFSQILSDLTPSSDADSSLNAEKPNRQCDKLSKSASRVHKKKNKENNNNNLTRTSTPNAASNIDNRPSSDDSDEIWTFQFKKSAPK